MMGLDLTTRVLREYGATAEAVHLWTASPLWLRPDIRDPIRRFAYTQSLFFTPGPWRFLHRALGVSPRDLRAVLGEFFRDAEFLEHLQRVLPKCRGAFAGLPLLYALSRLLRARQVLETGVSSGVSSAVLLLSLTRNPGGTLHSIDLPNYDGEWVERFSRGTGLVRGGRVDNSVPEGSRSGWAVPDALRSGWDLTLEDTSTALPRILGRLGELDLVLHDSDHSGEAIARESALMWAKVRPGGVLIVDDIDISGIFPDLVARYGPRAATTFGRFGIFVKPRSA